jgi:hypothetical protein
MDLDRTRFVRSLLFRSCALTAAGGLIALSGGCYTSTPTGAKTGDDQPAEAVASGDAASDSLEAGGPDDFEVTPEDIEQTRLMMEQAFASLENGSDTGSGTGTGTGSEQSVNDIAGSPDEASGAAVASNDSDTTETSGLGGDGDTAPDDSEAAALNALAQSQPASLEDLVAQAADLLAARARTSTDPAGDALALAALEAALPGLASRYLDAATDAENEGGDPADDLGLSQAERRVVNAVRNAMEVIQSGRAEPGLAAQRLRQLATALDSAEPLKIQTVALCTRVTGYGQFAPFPGTTFLAGRSQPMIVYVELDRFAHRDLNATPGSDDARSDGPRAVSASDIGSRYAVEVAMTLELFLMSSSGISADQPDALLVQRRPRAIDKRMSRNKLRDYYLVTRMDLPSTLRAGRYHLKVTVEDLVGCSNASPTVPARSWPWPTRRPSGSTTNTSGPSTSCSASSRKAPASAPTCSRTSASTSARSGSRSRSSSSRPRDGHHGQAAPDPAGQEGHRVRDRRGPQPQPQLRRHRAPAARPAA